MTSLIQRAPARLLSTCIGCIEEPCSYKTLVKHCCRQQTCGRNINHPVFLPFVSFWKNALYFIFFFYILLLLISFNPFFLSYFLFVFLFVCFLILLLFSNFFKILWYGHSSLCLSFWWQRLALIGKIYITGCLDAVLEWFRNHLVIVAAVAVAFAFPEVSILCSR